MTEAFDSRYTRLFLFRLMAILGGPVLVFGIAEWMVRLRVDVPPASFFVEEERDGIVWVLDNPYYGYTFQHPQQARHPAQNSFAKVKEEGTQRILLLGESAAMGFPRTEFGLGRMLLALLHAAEPAQRYELIDGTMTMINSHLLHEIAIEAMQYDPDYVVIYAGNNEAIGPYGPAGVFGYPYPSLYLVRLDRWLRTHSQFVRLLGRWRIDRQFADDTRWRGLDHFAESTVPADSRSLHRAYRYFERNIQRILRQAERRSVPVVLATPAVNMRSWPPLYSLVPDRLSAEYEPWLGLQEQAQAAMSAGQWSNALTHLHAAAEWAPHHAETFFNTARSLERMGQWQDMRQMDERAARLDAYRFRADQVIADIVLSLGALYPDESVRVVDTRTALYNDLSANPPLFLEHVHFTFAGTYAVAREMVSALLLRDAEAIAGIDVVRDILFHIPDIEAESWGAAIDFLQMDVFQGQTGYTQRIAAAKAYRAAADADSEIVDAAEMLQRRDIAVAASVQPNWMIAHLLGRYAVRRGEMEIARTAFKHAVRGKGNNPLHYEWLGYVEYHAGDLEKSVKTLEAGLAINPYMPSALNTLGLALFRLGEPGKAAKAYRRALAVQPSHSGALNNLGYLHYTQGDWAAAEKYLQASLHHNSASFEARYHLALVFVEQGRLTEAATEFARVVEQQPALVRAWSAWGQLSMQEGDTQTALEKFDRALELEPDRTDARVQRAMIWLFALDQTDKAVADMGIAHASRPDSAQVTFWYGLAKVRNHDVQAGLMLMEEAMAAAPQELEWRLQAAREYLLLHTGNPIYLAAARRHAEQVMQLTGRMHPEAARLLDFIQREMAK